MILKAMERISEDMHQCINFKEYNPDADAGWDNIYVSKTLNDGYVHTLYYLSCIFLAMYFIIYLFCTHCNNLFTDLSSFFAFYDVLEE